MSDNSLTRGRILAVLGSLLQIGTAVGLFKVASVLPNVLTALANGLALDALISGLVGEMLPYVFVEFVIGFTGLVLLCVALVSSRYRAA